MFEESSPLASMAGSRQLHLREDEFRSIIREDKTICKNWINIIREKLTSSCSISVKTHRLVTWPSPGARLFTGYARCRYKTCSASFKIIIKKEPDFSKHTHVVAVVSWDKEHVYSMQEELMIQRKDRKLIEGESSGDKLTLGAEMISFDSSNSKRNEEVSFKRPPMMGKVDFFLSKDEFKKMILNDKATTECYNIIRSHLNSACNIRFNNSYFARNMNFRVYTPYFSCQGVCTVKSCQAKYRAFVPEKPDFSNVPLSKVCVTWNHAHDSSDKDFCRRWKKF